MPHVATSTSSSSVKGAWRPTKIMNMKDLSRDDDFLSHLLVEKLGTGAVPLVVHKMDPSRRLPKSDAELLLQIIRRLVASKGPPQTAIKNAVDDLLGITAVRYYLSTYTQKQINAFATHATRYCELYLPSGSIEIAHTSRYSHRTGKSELCILATRPLIPGQVITELKGSMADLTEEEDKDLKRTDERHADGVGIRRDFSVIHSKQLKKNHLFLGPARFVNHDCDHNVELFREGRYITFRVIKPIAVSEEVTAHYGDGYFGRKNRHCLCETCERKGRGGYGPQTADDEDYSDSGASSPPRVNSHDRRSSSSSSSDEPSDSDEDNASVNINERRTRRGVYAVLPDEADAGESGQMELEAEVEPDVTSELTSLPPSRTSAGPLRTLNNGLMTPDPEPSIRGRTTALPSRQPSATPFRSVISTRAQSAREASREASVSIGRSSSKGKGVAGRSVSAARQLVTPPLTAENSASSAANSVRSSSRLKSRGAASGLMDKETISSRWSTPVKDKGKGRATASVSDARDLEKDEAEREARTLRPRASMTSLAESVSLKKLEEGPRGLDGKPLPTCITCSKVLPVISVDSEVVWGLSLGRTGKRGRPRKNADTECPRCMRHFAIYVVKWPDRVPSDGTAAFIPAPRVIKPYRPYDPSLAKIKQEPNSKSSTSTPAPAKPSHKRRRDDNEIDDDRPSKKKRGAISRPRGRPPKHKVGMSAKAQKMLKPETDNGRRSGRTRMPSLKLRESEQPSAILKVRISPRKNPGMPTPSSPLSTAPGSDDAATIELPTLVVPTTPVKEASSREELPKLPTPKSLAVAAQPREANGRFGKKSSTNGRFMRKNFSFGGKRSSKHKRGSHRGKGPVVKQEDHEGVDDRRLNGNGNLANNGGPSSKLAAETAQRIGEVLGKRPYDGDDTIEEVAKRVHRDTSEQGGSMAHPSIMKVGSALLGRPNPIAFARRRLWSHTPEEGPSRSTSTSVSVPTDDDSTPPITPEVDDHLDGVLDEEYSDDEDDPMASDDDFPPPRSLFSFNRLTARPSPLSFARRRWAPPAPRVSRTQTIQTVGKGLIRKNVDGAEMDIMGFELEYPEDEDDDYSWDSYSSDEDALVLGYPSDLEDEVASIPNVRACGSSTDSLHAVDSTDESERIVERLVAMSETRSTSSLGTNDNVPLLIRTPPTPLPLSLDNSPGMAWKKTVLVPSVDTSYLKTTFSLFKTLSASPTKLGDAEWEPSSSDIDT